MRIKDNFIIELTSLLILISVFNNIEGLGIIRIITISALMFIGTFSLILKLFKGRKIYLRFFLTYSLFLTFYFAGVLIYPEVSSIKTFLQGVGLINFFVSFSLLDYSACKFRIMRVGIIFYIISFFLLKINVLNYTRFWRMYTLFPFLMTYFLVLYYIKEHKKKYIFMGIILILMLFQFNSRSVILMVLTAVFVYLSWNKIIKSKSRYVIFLLLIFISVFLFMNIYINWFSNPNSITMKIQEFSQKAFGKNLYSGRQKLWINVLDKIKDNLVWGYGTGVGGGALIEAGMSVHNLYLQLLVQNGILGLGSFLILLISIWMMFWKSRIELLTRLSASFFIASIVHNTFELILLQNHMSMAFFQWFIFAIGISMGEEQVYSKR